MQEQIQTSPEMELYFNEIDSKIKTEYNLANKAKKKGYDPEIKVDIPLAKNMAERVEGLISTVAPQIIGSGISKRILDLEKKYKAMDWKISLIIAEEIAKEKFCKFKDKKEAMEVGIRVGFAYHTMGTVASPLEGFVGLDIRKRRDGKDYFALMYSGPIRSAGGTGGSVSVLIADYVRKKMGYSPYDPTEKEINRIIREVLDYHERATNLQYLPSEKELAFLARNLPVQIDGDPTEKIDVSNYKDIERIGTNRIRGGACLVFAECLAQKAPKLWNRLSKFSKEFDLEQWNFLEEFLDIQKEVKAKGKINNAGEKITPNYTFIQDLVAGRPILAFPLRTGGFRLRYGRSRTSGYSATSISPATMVVLQNYIATGTQLKVERPGKATTVSPCNCIEGPIVKLNNGSVLRLNSEQEAKKYVKDIKEIIFLGDILISYGDFFNRAHILVPPGYCEEWWIQELEKAIVDMFGTLDIIKLSNLIGIPEDNLSELLKNPFYIKPLAQDAIKLSKQLNIPLHPTYTFHWKTISFSELKILINWLNKMKIIREESKIKIVLPLKEEPKRVLELIGVQHSAVNNEFVVIREGDAIAFLSNLGISEKEDIEKSSKIIEENKEKNALDIINLLSKIEVRDKSGIFIGARMGRPEKAKMRKLTGSPHVLFPIGQEGDRLRSFQAALKNKKITSDFPIYKCEKCNKETIFPVCEICGRKTKKLYYCNICGNIETNKCKHGEAKAYKTQSIDINHYFNAGLTALKIKTCPDLIKGVRGTSNKEHIPEHFIKGILRAEHDIYVNKDGTTRYDMTQLPITHFKPREIRTSIKKLKEMGYVKDIYGKEIENDGQVLEIKPQDIILPSCPDSAEAGADTVLFNIANFVDDLLVRFYGEKPYYNLKSPEDLAGQLVIALAPHTSAGIVCRIIGFSKTQGFYAHPMIHAATRRDCDGDEASVMLAMDAFLNFSRQFLPAHRGSTQDACLVLTSKLTPSEVDDMFFDLDVGWKYPLEFYEACNKYNNPRDLNLNQVSTRLGTINQYENMGYTHPVENINSGVLCSAYKAIPSMEDKLKGQMELAEKIRAVNEAEVAAMVIDKHFIKDIKGNLRKFSIQQFRCVKCNKKFRRPPLIGKCDSCSGRIIFTISEGSIIKYLEPSISLANKYNVPAYLKQTLELTKRRVDDVFGKDKEKQEGLGKWFG
ncbi:MAG: DNA polymerase II large subunit [Nanoarchaeota archaeon]|nr:DNA polymerase II large subunit [Nanoarchaeota archaeon]